MAEGFATNFDAWNPDVPHLVGLMMIFPIGKKVKKTSPILQRIPMLDSHHLDVYDLCLANQRVILDSGPMIVAIYNPEHKITVLSGTSFTI